MVIASQVITYHSSNTTLSLPRKSQHQTIITSRIITVPQHIRFTYPTAVTRPSSPSPSPTNTPIFTSPFPQSLRQQSLQQHYHHRYYHPVIAPRHTFSTSQFRHQLQTAPFPRHRLGSPSSPLSLHYCSIISLPTLLDSSALHEKHRDPMSISV